VNELFTFFDKKMHARIDIKDLSKGLKDLEVHLDKKDIELFLKMNS
jgi:hypothetical protein